MDLFHTYSIISKCIFIIDTMLEANIWSSGHSVVILLNQFSLTNSNDHWLVNIFRKYVVYFFLEEIRGWGHHIIDNKFLSCSCNPTLARSLPFHFEGDLSRQLPWHYPHNIQWVNNSLRHYHYTPNNTMSELIAFRLQFLIAFERTFPLRLKW